MTQGLICSVAIFVCPASDYSASGFIEVIQKEHLFQVYSLNHGRIFDTVSRETAEFTQENSTTGQNTVNLAYSTLPTRYSACSSNKKARAMRT